MDSLLEDISPSVQMPHTAWADEFLKALGATQIEYIDNSAYEGATIIQDLGDPVPLNLHNGFDFVFDGGTLEHVFNFPVGIQNCMNLCKPEVMYAY